MDTHNDSTLCGLNKWFVHIFEKLGWIILANNKTEKHGSYQKKVEAYGSSVDKLMKDLSERVSNPRGNGTIETDFPTMIKNLEKLKSFLSRLTILEKLNSEGTNLSIDDMSLQWMNHYYKHLFEKFGWMVLVKYNIDAGEYSNKPDLQNHMQSKLDNFSRSIDVLLQSISHRILTTRDIDAENVRYDLMSMHLNLRVLNAATKSLLEQSQYNLQVNNLSPTSVDLSTMSDATSTMMPLNTEMRNDLVNEPTSVDLSTMSDATSTMMPLNTEMRNDLVNEPTSVDSTSMSNATSTMMPLDTEMRNNLVNEPTSVDSTSMSDNSSIRMTGGGNLLAKLLL
jgi:hypothetical protein